MLRRTAICASVALLLGPQLAAAQVSAAARDLSLFGVALKGASLETLANAATAAGATRHPLGRGEFPLFTVSAEKVPGMKTFVVVHDHGRVLSVQFRLSGDEDARVLRRLLEHKYGAPAVAVQPRAIGVTFTGAGVVDGVYEWQFRDGMKLTFVRRPGDEAGSLYYTDVDGLSDFATRRRTSDMRASKASSDALLQALAPLY